MIENNNSFLIIFLYIFHMLFWIFLIFGAFISIKVSKIIMFIIIPFVYLLHLLPFHVIEKKKINLIYNNLEYYKNIIPKEKFDNISPKDKMMSKALLHSMKNIPDKDKDLVINIHIIEEKKIPFMKEYKKIRGCFLNSFANPLSAQGLLILGYIVNLYTLKYYWKNI
jgi:hypothetical protein